MYKYFYKNGFFKEGETNKSKNKLYDTEKNLLCEGYDIFVYDNGFYQYRDNNRMYHLYNDQKEEVASGERVFAFINKDYWVKKKGSSRQFLLRDGKIILEGYTILKVPDSSNYTYTDDSGELKIFKS